MKIADIKIGNRVREDVGDLTDLCRSIKDVGLLQPVVVTAERELVAGRRRIAAFEKLGRADIPAVVVANLADALARLKAERDENTCRKAFTPGEAVEAAERIEDLFRKQNAAAKKAGAVAGGKTAGRGRPKAEKPSANLAEGLAPHDRQTRTRVAEAVGMKHATFEKAKAVVAAAAKEPEKFAPVVAAMNKTGNVDAAFREVKKAEREDQRGRAAEEAAKLLPPEDLGVRHADFRELAKDLETDSVDLVFTDPPYHREYLPLYGDLAREAARVLKPGGSLICYLGQFQIHEICSLVTPHLRLWWTLCCLHTAGSTRMTEYGIVVKWKPMLWFVKGTRGDKETFVDDLVESRREKDTHEWQQGTTEAAYYIDRLTLPGQLVFDPFCGGGTTAVAAKITGRRWLTCDVDATSVSLARKRIHDAAPRQS